MWLSLESSAIAAFLTMALEKVQFKGHKPFNERYVRYRTCLTGEYPCRWENRLTETTTSEILTQILT